MTKDCQNSAYAELVLKTFICFLFCYLAGANASAQMADPLIGQTTAPKQDSASFFEMSLEDLMKVQVTVASKKALTTRESPGIVTLITEEEIRNSGAQDLIDILQMVPGFNFGV